MPLFIGLVLCFCHLISAAQYDASEKYNKTADSLLFVLHSKGNSLTDSLRLVLLYNISFELSDTNPDTAVILCNQALELAKKINWKHGIASTYDLLGQINNTIGNYTIAITYYQKALKIRKTLDNPIKIAGTLNDIGIVYESLGTYPQAIECYLKALGIATKTNDKNLQTKLLVNIGNVYYSKNEFNKALDYYQKALKALDNLDIPDTKADVLANIGNVYNEKNELDKALDYYFAALKAGEDLNAPISVIIHLGNIGLVYKKQKKYILALDYNLKALNKAEKIGAKSEIVVLLRSIGNGYLEEKKYQQAEIYLLKALSMAKIMGFLKEIHDCNNALSQLYKQTNQPAKALEFLTAAIAVKDSLFNEENTKRIVSAEMNFEFGKKQAIAETQHKSELVKQAAIAEAEKKKQNVIIFSIVAGFLLVIVFSGFILRSLKITRKQKKLIEIKNKETEEQKKTIEEKNKDITDSITYAKRIQSAMLPDNKAITDVFPDSFILYKPKDIVSGDFYFFCPSPASNKSYFMAAADCTGHGVPGAFMSLIGNEKLKEAVAQSQKPEQILNLLNKGIKTSLHQSGNNQSTRDGMDIALVRIDLNEGSTTIIYAGANRPLWIIRNTTENKTIEEYKATKKAIGGLTEDEQYFDTHEIQLGKGDTFYLFTDGFADLFGQNGKKLMTRTFKKLLLEIHVKSMQNQAKHIEDFAANWRGNVEQIDDILIIGVRC